MGKINIIVTGPPRSGKSTLISKIIEELHKKGLKTGGISTPEVRERGVRIGFKIIDIASGNEAWMAHVNIKSPYRVSKYGVDLNAIESVGVNAILNAIESADVIIIDEIGKMELFSKEFQNAVSRALDSSKLVIGTMGLKIKHPFIEFIKKRKDVLIYYLERGRLNQVYTEIRKKVFEALNVV
ncbi:MAG: NTPase [Candidatus Baldrarchaeia archaeon]